MLQRNHRILVVGASFAGLTVAQRLLHLQRNNGNSSCNNNNNTTTDIDNYENVDSYSSPPPPRNNMEIVVDLVDALQEPSPEGTFVGDVCVPAALSILNDLGLLLCVNKTKIEDKDNSKGGNNNDNDPTMISLQGLLDALRHGIRIRYRHVVQEIFQNDSDDNNKLYYAVVDELRNASNTRSENRKQHKTDKAKTIIMGPYHAVVLATGVRSTVKINCRLSTSNNIFVVGDAHYTRWWDLGQYRIQQGANQAMLDGWSLAAALTRMMTTMMNDVVSNTASNGDSDNETGNWRNNVPDKFRLRTIHWHATWNCQWVILALMAIGIAMVMNFGHNITDRRIIELDA